MPGTPAEYAGLVAQYAYPTAVALLFSVHIVRVTARSTTGTQTFKVVVFSTHQSD